MYLALRFLNIISIRYGKSLSIVVTSGAPVRSPRPREDIQQTRVGVAPLASAHGAIVGSVPVQPPTRHDMRYHRSALLVFIAVALLTCRGVAKSWVVLCEFSYTTCPEATTVMLRGTLADPVSEHTCRDMAERLAAATDGGEAAYVLTADRLECLALGCNFSSVTPVAFGRDALPLTVWTGRAMQYVVRAGTLSVCSRLSSCGGRGTAHRVKGECRCECDDGWAGIDCSAALQPGTVSALDMRLALDCAAFTESTLESAVSAALQQALPQETGGGRKVVTVETVMLNETSALVRVRLGSVRLMTFIAENATALEALAVAITASSSPSITTRRSLL
jgi:hypothetical protein